MTSTSSHRIAIIGGGLAGLVLARILQIHGIEVVVYERELSRHARSQGGSLDLHVESGQRALREAGLEREFLAHARPEGQAMRILDKTGQVLFDEPAQPGAMDRPEIDRSALRDLLLYSLEPGTVCWNSHLRQLTPSAGNRFQLEFENGQTATADWVVGADGGRSRVRPLLCDIEPHYTGISFVDIDIKNAAQNYPDIARLVGQGSLFALGGAKAIISHLLGDGSVSVYLGLQVPEDWLDTCGIPFDQPGLARAALLSHFSDWAPELTNLIRDCNDSFVPLRLRMLPIGHRWRSKPGLTLIGDAAHLMSPFAGEGANLAMLDALELAQALRATTEIVAAVSAFETAMFARAELAAAQSAENLESGFAPNAAQNFADAMASYG